MNNLTNLASIAFNKVFLEHPNSIGQSWSGHALRSLRLACILAFGAGRAVVHAVIPALFPTSTTDLVVHLQDELRKRD